jgi:hypothetical protein
MFQVGFYFLFFFINGTGSLFGLIGYMLSLCKCDKLTIFMPGVFIQKIIFQGCLEVLLDSLLPKDILDEIASKDEAALQAEAEFQDASQDEAPSLDVAASLDQSAS